MIWRIFIYAMLAVALSGCSKPPATPAAELVNKEPVAATTPSPQVVHEQSAAEAERAANWQRIMDMRDGKPELNATPTGTPYVMTTPLPGYKPSALAKRQEREAKTRPAQGETLVEGESWLMPGAHWALKVKKR